MMLSWCATKSKSIWKAPPPLGTTPVPRPRGVTSRAEFHQWLVGGVFARRILPTIWVHMWTAWRVSFHSSYGRDGHRSSSFGDTAPERSPVRIRRPRPETAMTRLSAVNKPSQSDPDVLGGCVSERRGRHALEVLRRREAD